MAYEVTARKPANPASAMVGTSGRPDQRSGLPVAMIGNLVNCAPDELKAGLAVEAVFTPSADGSVKLVNWQPVAGAPG